MRAEPLSFLKELVEAPSPSGYEQPAAAVFRRYVSAHSDEVRTDVMGNVVARLKPKGKGGAASVMLAGHIDEIGFMVSYVTDQGFIAFKPIGGWDAHNLPGRRVYVHTADGPLLGVLGRLPVHLLEEDERKAVVKMHKLFIDLGLPGTEVKKRVRVGDPITVKEGLETFGQGMAVSRAFDDKMGAWAVAETLRLVKEAGGAKCEVFGVATVQEEVGLRGAITSAFHVDPEIGIAVEVGHATDYPDVDKRRHGQADCGKGPIIARGPNINPRLFELIVEVAEAEKIPHQLGSEPRGTGTDANAMQLARGGRAAALISVPLRYMHTPSEVLALDDLENTAKLLAALLLRLKPGVDFTP